MILIMNNDDCDDGVMMMMMVKKEGEEKNYLPSGWPDPRSPRCRNCAQRIVTIQQKDPNTYTDDRICPNMEYSI